MADSFFFYDLETSGTNPSQSRVMQFAGQRTTLDLEPLGDPVNVIIRLTPDVVPDPDAILITGITPQRTVQEGVTEYEFLQLFWQQVATPGTIFVGFNTVRFDDEFMRYMLYRNYYDPYEWQWKDGRSRWDLLDVVRMTRALRPDGITWPFDSKGKPSNRLELLTKANNIDHYAAHDALSDVHASIALARLLRSAQPKLFDYLLTMRDKKAVQQLVATEQPFVYSSGKYASEHEKTTVAVMIGAHPKKSAALVYDLRHDPTPFLQMTVSEIVAGLRARKDDTVVRVPVKTLQYNKCPAVAPLTVLDEHSQARISIDLANIQDHVRILQGAPQFADAVRTAIEQMDKDMQTELIANPRDVDARLYDGFVSDADKALEIEIRSADPAAITAVAARFRDARMQALAPLYKARNFADSLTSEEQQAWQMHCAAVLLGGEEKSRLARFFNRLSQLDQAQWITEDQRYLLEELQLYGQSLLPSDL